MDLDSVIIALNTLRVHSIFDEYKLQLMIAEKLSNFGIGFEKEYRLGPRNRVDFMVEGGIIIEVKKGKPNKRQVVDQLKRYAAFEEVKSIVLVIESNLYLPKDIGGKPLVCIGLSKLWGIAL